MQKVLKKRTIEEFNSDLPEDVGRSLMGKQLIFEDPALAGRQFHLCNLGAIFPDFDQEVASILKETLKRVYLDCGRNIDRTISTLERMQPVQPDPARSTPAHTKSARDNGADDHRIASEVTREINSLEERTQGELQRLGQRSQTDINQAVGELRNCRNSEDAEEVLKSLLNCVMGRPMN